MTRYFLSIVFLLIIITTNVFACDCNGTPGFETEYKSANTIFVGQVISIKPYQEENGQKYFKEFIIEFKVDKAYKGITLKTTKVRTAVAIASCGYPFEEGRIYLVYSYTKHESSYVTYCGRTKEINEAKEDIDKLKQL